MTPREKYDPKRKNFLEKTQKYFEFLVSDCGFNEPIYLINEQPNGTVISDELKYEHKGLKKSVIISNSYHPVDYGFEINLNDLTTGQSEMLHFVLKESQDMEQGYLKEAAKILKNELNNRFR